MPSVASADAPARGAAALWRGIRSQAFAMWRDTRGVALVGFALMAAAFLVSVIGAMEYGRILWIRNSLENAASETAHYAMIHAGATQQELVSYAQSEAAPLSPSNMTVQVSWDTSGATTFVTILMSYRTDIGIPFLPQATVTLVGRARTPQIS